MTERNDRLVETPRRSVLASVGLLGGFGSIEAVRGEKSALQAEYVLVQGERCVPITPLSGSKTVEELYEYRLPKEYVSKENGAVTGPRPYFSSVGTETLQRLDTSLLFLYDGPKGLSLVMVHGKVDTPGSGGSATFTFEGLPPTGRWVVKDDLYRDPDTGELADNNYDRWTLDTDVHTIDWTWGRHTDGGAFRDLGAEAEVTIDPAFNEDATLFGEHYEGTVVEWQLLTGDGDTPKRVSLDMTAPVTIRPGDCADDQKQVKHEKEQRKHRKKRRKHRRKHQKKQRKHEKKERKHERKERKKERKHERKEAKEERKHEKKERKHEKTEEVEEEEEAEDDE